MELVADFMMLEYSTFKKHTRFVVAYNSPTNIQPFFRFLQILDELIIGGEIQESSTAIVLEMVCSHLPHPTTTQHFVDPSFRHLGRKRRYQNSNTGCISRLIVQRGVQAALYLLGTQNLY